MNTFTVIRTGNLTPLNRPNSIDISLKVGDVLKAEVIDASKSGMVNLHIGSTINGSSNMIKARSYVPMTKGDKIFLEVLSSGRNIRLKLIVPSEEGLMASKAALTKAQKILSEISVSRLTRADIKMIREFFNKIPDSLKTYLPDIKMFNRFMPGIEQLTGRLLKEAVENSGVFFETRLLLSLKKLTQNQLDSKDSEVKDSEVKKDDNITSRDLKSVLSKIVDSHVKTDQKGLMLRLGELLKDEAFIDSFKFSDSNLRDMQETVNRFTENIEYYQLKSQDHGILYTFLPVLWQNLSDGELVFKKNSNKKSFTCNINLDLTSSGRLSISVTLFENEFFVNFCTEKLETKSFINSKKDILKKIFTDSGLKLKTISIYQKDDIVFGAPNYQEVSVRA